MASPSCFFRDPNTRRAVVAMHPLVARLDLRGIGSYSRQDADNAKFRVALFSWVTLRLCAEKN